MAERQNDPGEGDIPPDFDLLLTPDYHVRERLHEEKFIEFVESALTVITEYCNNPPSTLAELQVGCALLPENRLVVDIQTGPSEVRSLHAKGIAPRLRQLAVPSVEDGPVIFARRIRFRQTSEGSSCALPFACFVNTEQPTPLDEVLLEAGGVRLPSPSLWGKVKGFFAAKRATSPADSDSGEIAEAISRRTGVAVIACNGPLVVGGACEEPFTIVDDKTASEGLAAVKYANGASGVVDKLTLDYVQSRAPQPTQTAFNGMLAKVGRVRVLEGGMANGQPLGNTVLLEIATESDLEELKLALVILDGPYGSSCWSTA